MRFAEIKIKIYKVGDMFHSKISVFRINKYTKSVQFCTNDYIERNGMSTTYPFSVYVRNITCASIGFHSIYLPTRTSNMAPSAAQEMECGEFFDFKKIFSGDAIESRPVLIANEQTLKIWFSKMMKTLYFWDKRCGRSRNVKIKTKEEIPLEIDIFKEKIIVKTEEMPILANFIFA